MPKETVHYGPMWVVTPQPDGSAEGRQYLGEPLKEGQYLRSDPDVHITWGQFGMVQIGVTFERRQWEACITEQDERFPDHKETDKFGIYADLSRDDINRMIKALRKARRKTFPRDE